MAAMLETQEVNLVKMLSGVIDTTDASNIDPAEYTDTISIPYSKGVMFNFLSKAAAELFTNSPFLHT